MKMMKKVASNNTTKRKAQIAMESLLLYGVAILVVVLAVAALIYFGVLDLGQMLPEKCSMEGTGIFSCEEWAVKATDKTIQIVVLNKGTKGVTISKASFNPADPILAKDCESDETVDIPSGSKKAVKITCDSFEGEVNKKIKGTITIDHKFSDGILDMSTTGTLIATIR
ncbi:hypothetical protein JXA85_06185 [Candidatus Woesearchaeota archaeon]|nr:hypothetical protein [Candidatus Woesearchaeota archaeon]